ncbi:hypothetical protein OE749_08075 [Aestuariibacter sp. AA17]|uniref:Uncharacterized protein n=1 Tax=Fluctibacter corallii TaxID=2984329 RepID=A0ABT3A7J7_9ALTE|nr:hypothetical protein [Aestuariibacter sp. AA17]MCV2884650.1 hypothetical protein [Aestuariibacter sp. AA17]
MRKFILLNSLFAATFSHAVTISEVKVEETYAYITQKEPKTSSQLACVTEPDKPVWILDIGSERGRGNYVLLTTAIALNKPIHIDSANECQFGIELIKTIALFN